MLVHIVLFKFKESSPEAAHKVRDLLVGMKGRIPQLLDIEAGVDILRTERSYDLALITKFESVEKMQEYQVHPVHQEVTAFIKTVSASSIAVDYEA